eukprot:Skav222379  [mRNA]  locus=scaffold2692:315335:317907:- [translate_table: standard]
MCYEVNSDNTKAKSLYAKRGFVHASHRSPALALLAFPDLEDHGSLLDSVNAVEVVGKALGYGAFVVEPHFALRSCRCWSLGNVEMGCSGAGYRAYSNGHSQRLNDRMVSGDDPRQQSNGAVAIGVTFAGAALLWRAWPVISFIGGKIALKCDAMSCDVRLFGPFAFGPKSDQEELMRAVVSRPALSKQIGPLDPWDPLDPLDPLREGAAVNFSDLQIVGRAHNVAREAGYASCLQRP